MHLVLALHHDQMRILHLVQGNKPLSRPPLARDATKPLLEEEPIRQGPLQLASQYRILQYHLPSAV